MALALAAHHGLRVHVLLDERSAAFFGIGLARATRRPVVLLATSGTAAAEFLPAIVEASLGRVPLVVLTADRPVELRDKGAAQTIDQAHLYGGHARWFSELPTFDDTVIDPRARPLGGRGQWPSRPARTARPVRSTSMHPFANRSSRSERSVPGLISARACAARARPVHGRRW